MLKTYLMSLKREFGGYNPKAFLSDILAGLTVAAVALPLALAFGVSCGAGAAAGLVTAIIAGVVISALSGASYQISGPTGAMSAVLIVTITRFGLKSMFTICLMAGIILTVCAFLKIGRLVELIPRPVITGFTSGIAIIIATGQFDNFFGVSASGNIMEKAYAYFTKFNPMTVLICLLVVAVMIVFPKKWNAVVPSSLVGIIIATAVCAIFKIDVPCVGEIPKTLFLADRFSFAEIDFANLTGYISPAISVAALAMIESLLCGASASRMKQGEPFNADIELIAQGVGNIVIPFFGGVPATAAIARTSVAIKSGCRTRVCGISHALWLLATMFFLAPVMAKLPLSALAGVLIVTAWRMNEWESIAYFFKKKFVGASLMFLVTMVSTVVFDLTIAILIGVGCSCLLYIVNSAKLRVEFSRTVSSEGAGKTVVYITGPIFFATVGSLSESLKKIDESAGEIIFSFRGVPMIDISGVQFFDELCDSLLKQGKRIVICGAADEVKKNFVRAGLVDVVGESAFCQSLDIALGKTEK